MVNILPSFVQMFVLLAILKMSFTIPLNTWFIKWAAALKHLPSSPVSSGVETSQNITQSYSTRIIYLLLLQVG